MPQRNRRQAPPITLLGAALLCLSCGGGDRGSPPPAPGPGPSPGPAPSGGVQIRGGERLGWNQSAATLADLRGHTFQLFIDGSQAPLSDARCGDVAADAGYECSGRLPTTLPLGNRTLELAAVFNGQQSARSSPLRVTVVAALAPAPLGAGPSNLRQGGPDVLVDGLGAVSWLTASPDGRLFFVEDARVVRATDGDLLPQPAYEIDPSRGAIVGLAVDPHFVRTRAVYVAEAEYQPDGTTTLTLARFRDVGNTLGQRAVIASGLPFSRSAAAPLGVDGAGLVYMALPAAESGMMAGGTDRAGAVVRFTPDGRTPAGNPRATPQIALGFARPTALAVDDAGGRVWLAGTHAEWEFSLAVISMHPTPGASWPERPRPGLPQVAHDVGFKVLGLSIGAGRVLSVASREIVHVGAVAEGLFIAAETFRPDSEGAISSVAVTSEGETYAAVRSREGRSSSLRRLTVR